MRKACTVLIIFVILLIISCPEVSPNSDVRKIDIVGAESLAVKLIPKTTRSTSTTDQDYEKAFIKILANGTEEKVISYDIKNKPIKTISPDIIIPCNEQYVILGYEENVYDEWNYDPQVSYLVNRTTGVVYQLPSDFYYNITDLDLKLRSDKNHNIYYSTDPNSSGVNKIDTSDPNNVKIIVNYIPPEMKPYDFLIDQNGISWYFNNDLYLKPLDDEINTVATPTFNDLNLDLFAPPYPEEGFTLDGQEYIVASLTDPLANDDYYDDHYYSIFMNREIDWDKGTVVYNPVDDSRYPQYGGDNYSYYTQVRQILEYDIGTLIFFDYFSDSSLYFLEHDKHQNLRAHEVPLPYLFYGGYIKYRYPYIDFYESYNNSYNSSFIVYRYNVLSKSLNDIYITSSEFINPSFESLVFYPDGSISCEGTLLPSGNKGIVTIAPDGSRTYSDRGKNSSIIILEKLN